MLYDDNGNIDNKSDIGDYTYHSTKKNAVVMVDNIQNLIHSTTQDIEYDELHNPKSIVENGNEWHFEYDVNHHRNRAQIISSGGLTETRVYVGNSEYQYDQNGDLLYSVDYVAGGDCLCALVVRDYTPDAVTSEPQVFTVYKDYLGSINVLVDENGIVAAEQEFDPWGRYRDANTWTSSATLPALPSWLWRGYTGHEHIEEFQLINMNGRLYDPYIGRMLSPDNYVQDATSTQNYNRYSYALNNPLKYTDPSGEIVITFTAIVIGSALIGGGLNLWANADNVNSFGDGAYYFGVGAAVGAGAAVGGAALAPVIGTGAITGAVFGAAGGFVTGYANTGYATGNWGKSALQAGGQGALWGGIGGAVIGGSIAGFSGNNIWTGATPSPGSSLFSFRDIGGGVNSPSWNFSDAHNIGKGDFWKYGYNIRTNVESDNLNRVADAEAVQDLTKNHDIYASQPELKNAYVDDYYNQMVDGTFDPSQSPIAIMRDGNKYVVTDGHHRVAAASKYYLKTGDPSILQNLINHSPHHPGPASNYGYKLRFFPKRWR